MEVFEHGLSITIVALRGSVPSQWVLDFKAALGKYAGLTDKLLSVRPGLTGLWQVSGRQNVSYDKRVELDMEYVDQCSLAMDVSILLRTVPVVLKAEGAF